MTLDGRIHDVLTVVAVERVALARSIGAVSGAGVATDR
jgi:hypothetical protein